LNVKDTLAASFINNNASLFNAAFAMHDLSFLAEKFYQKKLEAGTQNAKDSSRARFISQNEIDGFLEAQRRQGPESITLFIASIIAVKMGDLRASGLKKWPIPLRVIDQ